MDLNYRELRTQLYAVSDGFTAEEGEFVVDTKSEVNIAIDILKDYYLNIKRMLNYPDGDKYRLIFSKPLEWRDEGENIMTESVEYVIEPTYDTAGVTKKEIEEYAKQRGLDYDTALRRYKMIMFMDDTNFDRVSRRIHSMGVDEAIEKHDTLNPKLWDGDKLKPEVEAKLREIVQKFDDNLKENDVELDVKDICIIGSNANYNYSPDSDIDLHIVADTSVYPNQEDLAMKVYQAYKSLFNNKYDPTINGIEAEIYVEPDAIQANSNGIYSLNNGWLKEPEQVDVPEIDPDHVQDLVKPFEDRYNEIIDSKDTTVDDVDQLIDDIYLQRQKSIMKDGEFGDGNICFKEFRNRGYLQNLRDLKVELENKEMSLKETKMHDHFYEMLDLHEDEEDVEFDWYKKSDIQPGQKFLEPLTGSTIEIQDVSDDIVTYVVTPEDGDSYVETDYISYIVAMLNEYGYNKVGDELNPELYKPFGHDSYDSGYVNDEGPAFDESLNEATGSDRDPKYDDYEVLGTTIKDSSGHIYYLYRKILTDENGKIIKGVWAAAPQDTTSGDRNKMYGPDESKMFDITYDQARGFEPLPGDHLFGLRRELGKTLLPEGVGAAASIDKLGDYIEYLGKRSNAFYYSDDETATKELKKKFPEITDKDLKIVLNRWHTGKLDLGEDFVPNEKLLDEVNAKLKGLKYNEPWSFEVGDNLKVELNPLDHGQFELVAYDKVTGEVIIWKAIGNEQFKKAKAKLRMAVKYGLGERDEKHVNEDLTEYPNGLEFDFPNPHDTLAVYLSWEGIVGFDDDIIEFYEDGGYDALSDYLDEEGIYGYTERIRNILDGEPAYCSQMEMEDFLSVCRHLYIDPTDAMTEPIGEEMSIDDILKRRKNGYSVSDLYEGQKFEKDDQLLTINQISGNVVSFEVKESDGYEWSDDASVRDFLKNINDYDYKAIDESLNEDVDHNITRQAYADAMALDNTEEDIQKFAYKYDLSFDTAAKVLKSIKLGLDWHKYFDGKDYGDIDWNDVIELDEDTVKQGDKWVNKGKEGTHGKFKTKKAADAQRKAMFANGFHESLSENIYSNGEDRIEVINSGDTVKYRYLDDFAEEDKEHELSKDEFNDLIYSNNFKLEEAIEKHGDRHIEKGINWTWFYTDSEEDANKWFFELMGVKPNKNTIDGPIERNHPGKFDSYWSFRMRNDLVDQLELDEAKYLGSCDDKKQIKDEKKKGIIQKDKKSKYDIKADESLNESFLDKITLQLDKDGIYAYEVGGSKLENEYGYYQGDVVLEDDDSQKRLKELGIKPGDKFVVGVNDDEENTVTILSKVEESLNGALKEDLAHTIAKLYSEDEYLWNLHDTDYTWLHNKLTPYLTDDEQSWDAGYGDPDHSWSLEEVLRRMPKAEQRAILKQLMAPVVEKAKKDPSLEDDYWWYFTESKVNESLTEGLTTDSKDALVSSFTRVATDDWSDEDLEDLYDQACKMANDEENLLANHGPAIKYLRKLADEAKEMLDEDLKQWFIEPSVGVVVKDGDHYKVVTSVKDGSEIARFGSEEEAKKVARDLGVEFTVHQDFPLKEEFHVGDKFVRPDGKYMVIDAIDGDDITTHDEKDGEKLEYNTYPGELTSQSTYVGKGTFDQILKLNKYKKVNEGMPDSVYNELVKSAPKTYVVDVYSGTENPKKYHYEINTGNNVYTKVYDKVWLANSMIVSKPQDSAEDMERVASELIDRYNCKEVSNDEYKEIVNKLVYKEEKSDKIELEGCDQPEEGKDMNIKLVEAEENDPKAVALAKFEDVDLDDISKDNEYDDCQYSIGGLEYLVCTEDEAYQHAVDEIKALFDDMGLDSFSKSFQKWVLNNAIDTEAAKDFIDQEIEYYRDEEDDPDMVDFLSSIDTDEEIMDYLEGTLGPDTLEEWAKDKIDLDKVAEEAIKWDGVAHFIALYDGDEIDLGNGLYAYRVN